MSYQNVTEAQVPGYNDCPVVDFTKTSKPKPRRLVHADPSSTNSSSTSLNTLMSKPPSLGPTRRVSRPVVETIVAIPDEVVLEHLDTLLAMKNRLPEKEFDHYKTKLYTAVKKGIDPLHKQVLIESIEGYKDAGSVKDKLVKFMLQNDGTSIWGTPLRKIIEGVEE